MIRDLHVSLLLAHAMCIRMLREGMVLRSLIWPTLIAAVTLLGTLAVVAAQVHEKPVLLTTDTPSHIRDSLHEAGFQTQFASAPKQRVYDGAWAGTDGQTLWTNDLGARALALEGTLRKAVGASWRPQAIQTKREGKSDGTHGRAICQLVAVLFALYGMVFGLGTVARDRDDGTLAADLVLPVSTWVHGWARWLAGTFLLSTSYLLCVLVFHSIMGLDEPAAILRHGIATAGASTAIGLVVVGRASLRQSFTGPFTLGSVLCTGLIGSGAAGAWWADFLPMASIYSDSDGWVAVCLSVLFGALGSAIFAYRGARL